MAAYRSCVCYLNAAIKLTHLYLLVLILTVEISSYDVISCLCLGHRADSSYSRCTCFLQKCFFKIRM